MALRTLKGEKLEAERARLALMREYHSYQYQQKVY